MIPAVPCSCPPQPAVCSTAVMLNPRPEFLRSETKWTPTWHNTDHLTGIHVETLTSWPCDMMRGGTVSPHPLHSTGLSGSPPFLKSIYYQYWLLLILNGVYPFFDTRSFS